MALLKDIEKEKPKKKPIVKRAPRTMKEKKFATTYVELAPQLGSADAKVIAVKEAGYRVASENGARAIASENLQKLAIADMMDTVPGLRKEDRLKILAQGLYATKANEFTGEVNPDHSSIYRYLRLSFELDGELKAGQTINNTQNNITVQPILSGLSNALPSDDSDEEASQA